MQRRFPYRSLPRSLRASFILFSLFGLFLLASPYRAAASDPVRIVFLGDSLTAGYGLTPDEAFPALIEEKLRSAGYSVDVVNAGLSGDTSAGGVRRVNWMLRRPADLLIVALGANDALRGLEVAQVEVNLQRIIDTARQTAPDIGIILAGMQAPPNMGAEYTEAFAALYPRLAERNQLPLIPFLLDGVAGNPRLNQSDAIHPTAEGQALIAELVYPFILEALRQQD